jgi:hypothetical protein
MPCRAGCSARSLGQPDVRAECPLAVPVVAAHGLLAAILVLVVLTAAGVG